MRNRSEMDLNVIRKARSLVMCQIRLRVTVLSRGVWSIGQRFWDTQMQIDKRQIDKM